MSVVTPVYNGAEYLAECLQSVLAQSYSNWTCTVVDNASSDATPEIVAAFAARDNRIRHLRFEEFVGATANHNRAFDAVAADSEFCKVLQADDWLYPECLARMVDAARVSKTVGVISSYQLWGRNLHLNGLPYATTFAQGRDILRRTLLGEFNVTGGPTANMLRTAVMKERRPFYLEGLRHDDNEAMLWMHTRSDLAFVHQILTFARRQEGSRYAWSDRMRSRRPEEIVFVLRYGRLVMPESEYRACLRRRLRDYVWWHVKQLARVSRMREPEFFDFHAEKRRQILAEANGDADVRVAMSVVRALLLRGAYMRVTDSTAGR